MPALTAGETAAIESAVQLIAAAQAARSEPLQVPQDGASIESLGVSAQLVTAALAAGFSFRVDELLRVDREWGEERGFRVEVTLRRDGAWRLVHEDFAGVVTRTDWHLVPEGPPWR